MPRAGGRTLRPRYENPKKSIDECCDYILDCVYESGQNGFADDEIYALALHYYDEDDIEVGKHRECRVIVNHTIELTEEEKAEAGAKRCDVPPRKPMHN